MQSKRDIDVQQNFMLFYVIQPTVRIPRIQSVSPFSWCPHSFLYIPSLEVFFLEENTFALFLPALSCVFYKNITCNVLSKQKLKELK